MKSETDLNALGEVEFRRFRKTFGFVDSLSLSAEFGFPVDTEIKVDGARTNEATKTVLHETTHVYQATATSYGYYIQALRDFQTHLAQFIVRHVLDAAKVSPERPLILQLKNLPRSEDAEQARNALFIWYLAELIIVGFEGEWPVYYGLVLRARFPTARRPFMENFFILDKYLGDFLRRTGRAAPPESHEPTEPLTGELLRRFELQQRVAVALTGFMGNVESLIESGARAAEYWRQEGPVPAALLSSTVRGDWLLRDTAERLPGADIGTIALTHGVLADLCLNPAILPHHRLERRCRPGGIPEIDPKLRWLGAHGLLNSVAPVRDLAQDYERFVAEISEAMGWTPMPALTLAALRHTATEPVDVMTRLYRQSLLIREAEPYGFSDFDVWLGEGGPRAATIAGTFRPMVNVFADGQVRTHPDSVLVTASVRNFMRRQYMRQVLLSEFRDRVVYVPYEASDDDLAAWAEFLSADLAAAGVNWPSVPVRGRPAQIHGLVGQQPLTS
jgi:hypothetical protein